MNMNNSLKTRMLLLVSAMLLISLASSRLRADTAVCGGQSITLPFVDVLAVNPFFCAIAEAYFSGLTNGTSTTTYSPSATVSREHMAAFTTRAMNQALKRGSRRAVVKKWWTPQNASSLTLTDVGNAPQSVEFDGTDLWVANNDSDSVMRIRPSDGKLLDTWTGANSAFGIVCAMGRIFITGQTNPGRLYMIDPTQPAGAVTTVTSSLGNGPHGIAFDGSRIWTTNTSSVSIVSLNPTSVTTVSTGFTFPNGMLYDGANIWVTEGSARDLLKLNADGSIAQTVKVGSGPQYPVFDGTNIWVPNFSVDSVTVVRVKDATGNPLASAFVLTTLTGNELFAPTTAAFDGERILVTNNGGGVSLWKAADLTPLGFFAPGISAIGACSDGLNFWVTFRSINKLARF